jgi:hypothetical protein
MTDLVAILGVYGGLFGAPAAGAVAVATRLRVGRWPWEYGVGTTDVIETIAARARRHGREYVGGWRADVRDGEVLNRFLAFVVSFGLLYRAMIHTLVAVGTYPDRDFEIDYGLVWAPVEMDRGPLWTARILTLGSGLCLAVLTGWPVWAWPEWVQWLARAYLFAQIGVWCAEPIAILRDHVQ